ncbi:MAG: rRNA methyltransferase [Cytophagales bacterium]|jgi:16S rRNA C967 or C1407 C5-methylase (RsmB/RsmF family)/NOL1/NOP2/fmu family ribosome biogenesis protein|nr:rRNA methyltransferase [Cytophagales bacterium]MCA6388079.1 rRNA methyltransferase [Cytophagales bacterium]MCA6391928.1 rRNA methyltransferase [Cytophagales bacterium]MCA6396591.1 rRNA methyltransferase [Cytophagales bacterium]MCA6399021.1 rRNA methyltransferase [Cytophagales bacterium]
MQFPEAFQKRMQATLAEEWPAFEAIHQQPSFTSIRLNPAKQKPYDLTKIAWTDFGYFLPERPSFTLDPTFHAGTYYVQEASSMFLEQALKQTVDLTKPLRVLDLCAAPGGKSTHLLSLLNQESLLVSNEVIRSRASILSENIQKWGNANVVVTNNDPKDFQRLNGFFDVMVVDAPCSGEGLFRKDPKAMEEWSEDNVALCAQRQQRILADVWPALKQDGILIYCTCTYNAKENEENIGWLIHNSKFKIQSLRVEHNNDWGVEEIIKNGIYGYRFFPHKVKGEGFFISVLRKKDEAEEVTMRTKTQLPLVSKKIAERVNDWLLHTHQLILLDDLIVALPEQFSTEINWLANNLNVVTKGTAVAMLKHEKLIPEHAMALSLELNRNQFTEIELSLDQALAYLRKETPLIGEGQKGFALVTYKNHPLGWVNLLGNRINNLYPANWRVRMGG